MSASVTLMDSNENRINTDVMVKVEFSNSIPIPSSGSVQIVFPPEF
jgi:hypothetical protein